MTANTLGKEYSIVDVSNLITDDTQYTFEDLVVDDYHPDGMRYRRFSQFRLSHSEPSWNLQRLPIRPFSQKFANNKLVGNMLRYFPPIRAEFEDIILAGIENSAISKESLWQVNCHQVRVLASTAMQGRAAPEGVHRDGVDYIFMVCIARENIAGAQSEIYSNEQELVFSTELQAGSGLVVNDRAVFHNVTEFDISDPTKPGWRDMFIIAFMPWLEGRYGPEYEIKVTGQEADRQKINAVKDL